MTTISRVSDKEGRKVDESKQEKFDASKEKMRQEEQERRKNFPVQEDKPPRAGKDKSDS